MSNLDRFMEAIIPKSVNIKIHSIQDVIRQFHSPSVHGLKVELFDDRNYNVEYVCTFLPTLSSLYLMTKSQQQTNHQQTVPEKDKLKQSRLIEYHEY
jgi:hypothetical protein